MAVAFDNSGQGGTGNGSSSTWSHTTAGTGRVMLILEVSNNSTDITTAPTYNSVSATKVNTVQTPSGNFLSVWYIAGDTNVASGANTVQINASASGHALYGISLSYNGAAQTQADIVTSSVTNTLANSGGMTSSLNTTVNNSMVAMFTNNTTSQAAAGTGTTSRQVNTSVDVGTQAFDNVSPASGTITEAYTCNVGANNSAILAQIAPAAVAGGTTARRFNSLLISGD